MRKLIGIAVCAGALFAAGACGGGGSDQEDIANNLIDALEDQDIDLDEDCARDVAAKFSDDDAKKITDNFDSTEAPDLSPEGQGLLIQLFSCADVSGVDISTGDIPTSIGGSLPVVSIDPDTFDSIVDQVVANLPEGVDEDCVRQALDDVDPSQISSGQAPEIASAMVACMTGG